MKRYMNYGGRSFAAGGAMPMEQLTEFNEGGRHEENSLGGIPQGMNSQGQMNLVEEGETKFDAENYIYSDSLKVDKELAEAFNLSPKMVGKTFADASKMAGRKKSKREGDAIENAANEEDLINLMEAQEAFKQARIEEKLQEIAELDPEALPALMGQGQPQGDPAMGGQMQEAPMDEQAMMEQQMMAEQQGGGGQPSPEEMAMMQQQQDMAIGQQEGMMRAGGKLPKEVLKARVQSHMSPAEANAYVNSYGNGGYTRSYNPGGFMGMNMANAGMMTSGPCGTPGNPPCPGEETKFNKIKIGRTEQGDDGLTDAQKIQLEISPGKYKPTLSIEERKAQKAQKAAEKLLMDAPSSTGLGYTYLTQGDVELFDDPKFEGVEVGVPQGSFVNRNKLARQVSKNPTEYYYKAGDLSDKAAVERANLLNQARINKYNIKNFGGNLMQSGQEAGLNPMQGLESQMRSGGKMCYGCGGAMHNYGGYMNNMPDKKFEFGAGLDIASNVLDKASTFMPPVFKEIAKTASNITGTMADKKQGQAVTKGDYIGDVISGATASIPGADKFVDTVTDLATSKNKERQNQMREDAINNPNDPLHEKVIDQEKAMAESKQLQNANKFNKVLDSTLGVATQFINPGEDAGKNAGEVMDTIDDMDDIPDLNFARYGKKLHRSGGGLWANIHAKRARIAAGSEETMRKPGSKGAPTAEALKNSQNAMGGHLYSTGGYTDVTNPLYDPNNAISNFNLSTGDDETYGEDMNSAFIDMSTSANPTDLISPMYNLGMGLFGKDADTSYDIEQYTYKPFDFTQTKNALRRQTAKAINQLGRKSTGNPSNLLALSQIGAKLEADYLAKAQNINIKREQAASDKNTKAKNAYEKEQKDLELKQKTIKDELIKAGLKDIQGISDKNAQTEYMFKFMQAMAPDVVRGSYKNMSQMFMDVFKKKNNSLKK